MASLDHIGLTVTDFAAAKAFYGAALKPLGITLLMEFPGAAGLGADGKPFFWLTGGAKTTPHVHIAFAAESRAKVDAFYKAAIAAGGKDNGPPGIRADYHPNYYGAFVLDADGHNIEAVCHKPEQAEGKR
jgi:catechol 2,3-dioxygenase-like lactoylglutathione lyase family enzyme